MLSRERLRAITEAHKRQRAETLRAAQVAEQTAAQVKAAVILEQIDSRMLAEAHCGRNHAIVMGLKLYEDTVDRGVHFKDENGNWGHRLTKDKLRGAAALVFAECERRNLGPTVQYWYAGDGSMDGFNIVVHW